MTRLRALAAAVVAATALACAATAWAASGERIGLRGGVHPDYARIVFDWTRPVDYQARLEGAELTVEFSRSADFDLQNLKEDLENRVLGVRTSPNSRSIVFTLAKPFGLKHFKLGPKVVIDLVGDGNQNGESTGPAVRLRIGRHPDFTRLVFDWPETVDMDLAESPGNVTLRFDRPAALDLSRYRADPPKDIANLRASRAGDATVVTFEVPAGAKVRSFRDGSKVAVDVSREENPRRSATQDIVKADAAGTQAAASQSQGEPKSQATGGKRPEKTAEVTAGPSESSTADVPTAQKAAPQSPGREQAARRPLGSQQGAEITAQATELPVRAETPGLGRRPDPEYQVVMSFDWGLPTAAAAFRRGPHIWLLFDRPPPQGLLESLAETAPELAPIRLLDVEGFTVLQVTAAAGQTARLEREGNVWKADIGPRPLLPERPISAELTDDQDGVGRLVRFSALGFGKMARVLDPQIDDRLVIVPVSIAGQAVQRPLDFPQFHILPSQLGLVLIPKSAGLEVAVAREGVLVRDRGGLLASSPAERGAAPPKDEQEVRAPRLFDLPRWRRGSAGQFTEHKQALLSALVGADGPQADLARYDLARYYFSHGLAAEAVGILQVIDASNPRLAADPEPLLIKAASAFLTEKYAAAAELLSHPALIHEREATLWRAALSAASQDWQAAAAGFAVTDDLFADYPESVRKRLHLLAAEANLGVGDTGLASVHLAKVDEDSPTEAERLEAKYLEGLRLYVEDKREPAVALWQEVAAGPHRPSQARARLSLVESGLREGALSGGEAVEELERLRFAWRGDAFELTLLRRLADLYVAEERYREALLALREAAAHQHAAGRSRRNVERMREIFASLYLREEGLRIAPLRALAIYEEFKELTPVGEVGDQIITRLADRLVEVDLLDRAAELLDAQVRYRLTSLPKCRVGARLALIRLLNRKPGAALEALAISEGDGLPEPLARQRRQLKARSLAEQNRSGDALALLEGDDTVDAVKLRAEILWKEQDWAAVASELEKLVPQGTPKKELGEDEANAVINIAVALTLADDRIRLKVLNRRFADAMEASPYRDAFSLLAGEIDSRGVRSITEELAAVAPAQAFLSSYRARLQSEQLSSLN